MSNTLQKEEIKKQFWNKMLTCSSRDDYEAFIDYMLNILDQQIALKVEEIRKEIEQNKIPNPSMQDQLDFNYAMESVLEVPSLSTKNIKTHSVDVNGNCNMGCC